MLRAQRLVLSVVTGVWLATIAAHAHGQADGEPVARNAVDRVGEGTTIDGEAAVVVWLTPRVVFATLPLASACAGPLCRPVVAREHCGLPECPTSGWRHAVEEGVADVPRWSSARYESEMQALRDDPRLEAMLHPEPLPEELPPMFEEMPNSLAPPDGGWSVELPKWRIERAFTLGFEMDSGFTLGTFVEAEGVWTGASGGLSVQFDLDRASAYGPFDALFFDGAGLGVRGHVLSRTDGPNSGEWIAMVGAGVTTSNRVTSSPVRVPTLFSLVFPEAGAVFRSDGTLSGYVGWALPVTVLLFSHLALDVRPRVLVTFFPEESEQEADVFLGVSVGLALTQVRGELPSPRPWGLY